MASASKTVFFYITAQGRGLAESLSLGFPGAALLRFSGGAVADHWKTGARFVFIMAAGIVVRTIAPLLTDKRTDPAVIVLDEKGRHAISLVGGHVAGANALAAEIARLCGGDAIITTASDVNGLPAIDLWAKAQGLVPEDPKGFAGAGRKLLDRKSLRLFSDVSVEAAQSFEIVDAPERADIIVTNRESAAAGMQPSALVLRPQTSSPVSDATAAPRRTRSSRQSGWPSPATAFPFCRSPQLRPSTGKAASPDCGHSQEATASP